MVRLIHNLYIRTESVQNLSSCMKILIQRKPISYHFLYKFSTETSCFGTQLLACICGRKRLHIRYIIMFLVSFSVHTDINSVHKMLFYVPNIRYIKINSVLTS
jgi:hypothetical protein